MLAEVWRGLGFWTLYFLASLQNIPEELLDAARVDGAKGVQRFRRVTIPLLRPMLLFAVVIAIIANFQVFDTVYVLTQGGPHESTSTLVWFIWKRLFQFQETGQGYAAAVLLLGIILALTAISFWLLGARRRSGSPMATHDASVEGAERPSEYAAELLAGRPPQPGRPLRQGARRIRGPGRLRDHRGGAVHLPALAVVPAELRALQLPPEVDPTLVLHGELRHDPERHELSALGPQHPHLRDLCDRDHVGHRHAGRLCVRTASLPGRTALFALVLSTLMIPTAVLIAPLYIMISHLPAWTHSGINTYPGMILPMVCSPLGVFMMRQFISTLPEALVEAARLDGASEWQIFRKIVLPLMKPAIVVLGIFTFMFQWVNFLWPLVITTTDNMKTLTVGVASLQGQFVTNWGVISAAAVMTMVPVIIIFLVFQRWFVQASMAGALKQ